MSELQAQFKADAAVQQQWNSMVQSQLQRRPGTGYGGFQPVRKALFRHLRLPEPANAAASNHVLDHIKASMRVLVLGASAAADLSVALHEDGFLSLASIDTDAAAIVALREQHPSLRWEILDMTRMPLVGDASFDLVFDRGALDALWHSDERGARGDAMRLFREVQRVLAPGGRLLCVTMAQQRVLDHMLTFYCQIAGWHTAVDVLLAGTVTTESPLVPFLVTVTKPTEAEATSESCCDVEFQGLMHSNDDGEARKRWLLGQISAQQSDLLRRVGLKEQLQPGRQEVLKLHGTDNNPWPRYVLRVIDSRAESFNGCCAAFVIPQGQEDDFLFSTYAGAADLADNAGFSRFILIALGHTHDFQDMEQVQCELTAQVLALAPPKMDPNESIPFLTMGSEMNARRVVCSGTSATSGDYIVEEAADYTEPSPAAKTTTRKKKRPNKKNAEKPHQNQDQSKSHVTITPAFHPASPSSFKATLAALHASSAGLAAHKTLLMGFQGGLLASQLHHAVASIDITTSEIDMEIVQVAKKYMELPQDKRLRNLTPQQLFAVDVKSRKDEDRYDSVIVKIDNEMMAEEQFLTRVYHLLRPNGVLVAHVSTGSDLQLLEMAKTRLSTTFAAACGTSKSNLKTRTTAPVYEVPINKLERTRVLFVFQRALRPAGAMIKRLKEQAKAPKGGDLTYVDDQLCDLVRSIQIAPQA